jgi:hypothetical protein
MAEEKALIVRSYKAKVDSKEKGKGFDEDQFAEFDLNFQNYLIDLERQKEENKRGIRVAKELLDGNHSRFHVEDLDEENLVYGTPEWSAYKKMKAKKEEKTHKSHIPRKLTV